VVTGDRLVPLTLTSMTGESITIPDPDGRVVHLQFRRFAGCPICDLHLRSITGRLEEITAAGVRVDLEHRGIVELVKGHSAHARTVVR
jgi:peroxiredoxin